MLAVHTDLVIVALGRPMPDTSVLRAPLSSHQSHTPRSHQRRDPERSPPSRRLAAPTVARTVLSHPAPADRPVSAAKARARVLLPKDVRAPHNQNTYSLNNSKARANRVPRACLANWVTPCIY